MSWEFWRNWIGEGTGLRSIQRLGLRGGSKMAEIYLVGQVVWGAIAVGIISGGGFITYLVVSSIMEG